MSKGEIIDISSSSDEEDELPLMHLLRAQLKKHPNINTPMKDENKKSNKTKYQNYDADCVVLDYNPFESIVKLSLNNRDKEAEADADADADDVTIISEKGQVACRDFPHSRHLCVKFPFDVTPHLSHCQQCYCYVCDCVAPCKFWTDNIGGHCHATRSSVWDEMRVAARPTPTPH